MPRSSRSGRAMDDAGPPWPPASVEIILREDASSALPETLASQLAPDADVRVWLLQSWLRPTRLIDGAWLEQVAGAGWWGRTRWRAPVPRLAPGRVEGVGPPALSARGPPGGGGRPLRPRPRGVIDPSGNIAPMIARHAGRSGQAARPCHSVIDGASLRDPTRRDAPPRSAPRAPARRRSCAWLRASIAWTTARSISMPGCTPAPCREERRVGLVFQDVMPAPALPVGRRERRVPPARPIGRRERRRRGVGEVLGLVGIDSLSGKGLDGLSALQRRRIELAPALAIEPELLILDEPSERLDPRDQSEFRDGVRRIQAESRVTILVLTRDPREAITWGDRLAVLNLGRIVQVGTPREVYNHPANTFVARLLGATNLMQGQRRRHRLARRGRRPDPPRPADRARLGGDPRRGAAVTVSIRPEALTLGPTVPIGSNRFRHRRSAGLPGRGPPRSTSGAPATGRWSR